MGDQSRPNPNFRSSEIIARAELFRYPMVCDWIQAPFLWMDEYEHDPIWVAFSSPERSMFVKYKKRPFTDYQKEFAEMMKIKLSKAEQPYEIDSVGFSSKKVIPKGLEIDTPGLIDPYGDNRVSFVMAYARQIFNDFGWQQAKRVRMDCAGENFDALANYHENFHPIQSSIQMGDLKKNKLMLALAKVMEDFDGEKRKHVKPPEGEYNTSKSMQNQVIMEADLFSPSMFSAWCKSPGFMFGYRDDPLWLVFTTIANRRMAVKYVKKTHEYRKGRKDSEAEIGVTQVIRGRFADMLKAVGTKEGGGIEKFEVMPESLKYDFQGVEFCDGDPRKNHYGTDVPMHERVRMVMGALENLFMPGCVIMRATKYFAPTNDYIDFSDTSISGFTMDLTRSIDEKIENDTRRIRED